ncbi:MAG: hypothetical protein QOH25_1893 [Acidobacteriota bacterium]|jgi:methylase of polypeptide subunit release factors|nr:hypothetical protein [Acidobacteriota bacterium]
MARTSRADGQHVLDIEGSAKTSLDNYSCEELNPRLSAFVESFQHEGNLDGYAINPINQIITGRKSDPLYMLHSYWAKKPFDAIRTFIEHFTEEGDIVLDPFLGSGSTVLVAALCGRNAIGADVSPSAMKIACGYCNDHPFNELIRLRDALLSDIWKEIGWLFQLKDKYIRSIVISEKFRCVKCFRTVSVAEMGLEDQRDECPYCEEKVNTRTLTYLKNSASPFSVDIQDAKISHRASDSFIVGQSTKYDQAFADLYKRIEEAPEINLPSDRLIPQRLIDLGGRLQSSGTLSTSQLHSKRQRLMLSGIRRIINQKQCSFSGKKSLEFIFSSILLNATQMYRVRKGGGGGVAGAYYVPPVRRETNAYRVFAEKFDDLLKAQKFYPIDGIGEKIALSRQSAGDLSNIPSNSIDYIFTDPPYADTMPFAALNAVYDYWFETDSTYTAFEAIGDDWIDIMSAFFKEAYRVLKPGRWLSLCYHDTSEGTWVKVQDLAAEAGLISDTVNKAVGIDAKQKAYQQTVGDKVTKRDLVINFRKPKPGETTASLTITGEEDDTTFNEKVYVIIRDYLITNPGSSKDRIYDEVVSRMVSAGIMEAHDFNELLTQIAMEVREPLSGNAPDDQGHNVSISSRTGRWYLKETEMAVVDSAESAKEDAAAASIKSFITEHLTKHRGAEGVHYGDLFEHFVYTVKDKTRRPLAEWLLDYFYKTDEGTYRLPASDEEEELKRQGRASGTNRRIKRYIAYLQQGVAVPEKERPNDATLAEWIRSAKRSGMYEAGKILYEKGGLNLDDLPEDLMVKVEEDYQVCVRLLARAIEQPRAARKTGKKAK